MTPASVQMSGRVVAVSREVAHVGTHTAETSDVVCFRSAAAAGRRAWPAQGLEGKSRNFPVGHAPFWNLDFQVSVPALGDPCIPLRLEGCSPLPGTHLPCQVLSSTGSAVEVQHGNLDLCKNHLPLFLHASFCWMGTWREHKARNHLLRPPSCMV